MKSVVVIGGGISGLSAAYFLSKAGLRCTLVEERSRLGGVIGTENIDGTLVEIGPDSFIAQKPWAMELIRELGLEGDVIGSRDHARKTFVVRDGRLIALPEGLQFLAPTKLRPTLTTKLFSWKTKLGFAAEYFRRPSRTDKDRSVAEFVREHYGEEVNRYLAQPMLAGVYGGSSEKLSVNSVLPTFVDIESKYGSLTRGILAGRKNNKQDGGKDGPRQSLFLTFKGGLQQLIDTLQARIAGSVDRVEASVIVVERAATGFRLLLSDGGSIEAMHVILAIPAYRAADLVQPLDGELTDVLRTIPYHSSITTALLYEQKKMERPLDGFGFLVPESENRSLAACTWVNTKFDHRAAPGVAYLRAFLAANQTERLVSRSDADLTKLVHQEVSELMGFHCPPKNTRVDRWERVMAQYEVGHGRRLDQIEQRVQGLPGIHLGGNGYTGIGIPDCIRRSRRIAEQIVKPD